MMQQDMQQDMQHYTHSFILLSPMIYSSLFDLLTEACLESVTGGARFLSLWKQPTYKLFFLTAALVYILKSMHVNALYWPSYTHWVTCNILDREVGLNGCLYISMIDVAVPQIEMKYSICVFWLWFPGSIHCTAKHLLRAGLTRRLAVHTQTS